MPKPRKKPRLATAYKMAEAFRLVHQEGLECTHVARLFGCSEYHVSGNILRDREHAEALFFLLKHGRVKFEAHYKELSIEGATIESIGLARLPGMAEYPMDIIESNTPSEETVKPSASYPQYSFLKGSQAESWFRALESGVEQWIACDCAGLDREKPHEWVKKAKTGSAEHAQWLEDCKRISSRAYIRLREKLAQAPKTWKGIDAALRTFVVFDGVDVGKTSAEEMKEILLQLMPAIEEG